MAQKRGRSSSSAAAFFHAKLLKRRNVYLKLTRHNGRAGAHGTYNPKHNDRSFNLANSEHIDPERAKGNIYWDCFHGFRSALDPQDPDDLAATFSGIFPGGMLLHIGNTRICAVQGGYLKQLTVDMTTRNYLASLGRSEEAEHCNSSEITACFGGGRESFYAPVIFEIPLTGALLMTSDGVHDHVTTDDLESIISNAGSDPDVLRGMISRALECGSEDDLSAVLLKF